MAEPTPPMPEQQQPTPGSSAAMDPPPDYGEDSYVGCGRLEGKAAIITGADSGIGRAVALAFAREGADILISYLNEEEDAQETKRLVEEAGRLAILAAGDIGDAAHCRALVERALGELGGIDILVNNAAHQMTFEALTDIPDEEWELTFRTNIHAMFYLAKAAVPHMQPGSAIINTTRSTPTSRSPRCWLMRRPRARSRTSRAGWRSCSGARASASIAWRPAPSGPRSFRPPCRPTR